MTITQKLATRANDIFNDADLMRAAQSTIEQLKAHLTAVLAETKYVCRQPTTCNTTAACRAQQLLAELEAKA
jgi:hypothetical protein